MDSVFDKQTTTGSNRFDGQTTNNRETDTERQTDDCQTHREMDRQTHEFIDRQI